jgi:hypothetical protein
MMNGSAPGWLRSAIGLASFRHGPFDRIGMTLDWSWGYLGDACDPSFEGSPPFGFPFSLAIFAVFLPLRLRMASLAREGTLTLLGSSGDLARDGMVDSLAQARRLFFSALAADLVIGG